MKTTRPAPYYLLPQVQDLRQAARHALALGAEFVIFAGANGVEARAVVGSTPGCGVAFCVEVDQVQAGDLERAAAEMKKQAESMQSSCNQGGNTRCPRRRTSRLP